MAEEEPPPTPPGAVGLSVEPGGLLIQRVEPGQTYDLYEKAGVAFIIRNQAPHPRTFRLAVHRPSAVGSGTWLQGYQEIPDPSWFWFERREVLVDARGEASVKMFLKVPKEQRYDNQHWTVSVSVTSAPEAGDTVALAAYPRYQIETVSKAGVAPAGVLAVSPSVVQMRQAKPGGAPPTARIVVDNNDQVPHHYAVSVKTVVIDPSREQITPSPGYVWILDPAWLHLSETTLIIASQQHHVITVTASPPQQEEKFLGRHWEALLWIQPDAGRPSFARLQLDTEPL